jgi:hypothetical protein
MDAMGVVCKIKHPNINVVTGASFGANGDLYVISPLSDQVQKPNHL